MTADALFWRQEFPDPGPQEGLDESLVRGVWMPYPARGKTFDGVVFFPRTVHATREKAVRWAYVHDSPDPERPGDEDYRQRYQRRYYRVEPCGDGWQVWTSRYARQNIDRHPEIYVREGA